MARSVRNRNLLPNNLPQLQNLIKRDSSAYKEEFLQQFHHYQALMKLLLINPTQELQKLQELVMFVSQVRKRELVLHQVLSVNGLHACLIVV